jgi:hypothetical protein
MGGMRNTYNLVGKPEGKKLPETYKRRWVGRPNIETDLKEIALPCCKC